MLISDDPAAFFYVHSLDEGRSNSVIPAYPLEDGTSSGVWRWKTILEEAPLLKTPSQMLDHKCAGEPRWICTLCNFKTDNYEDFAQDLFGDAHDELLFSYTHFPPTQIDIFLRFRDDKDRMLDMLELEQERLSSDKDDAQSEVRDVLCLEQESLKEESLSRKPQAEVEGGEEEGEKEAQAIRGQNIVEKEDEEESRRTKEEIGAIFLSPKERRRQPHGRHGRLSHGRPHGRVWRT